jgi:uncharacterized protein (TIGR02757 family)
VSATPSSSFTERRILLEDAYFTFNRREMVYPDPVEFLYRYDDPLDREIVALIASTLAYGRVAGIHRSIAWVLDRIQAPRAAVCRRDISIVAEALAGFRHRFTTDRELISLLAGIRRAIRRYGSLKSCFLAGLSLHDGNTQDALRRFVAQLNPADLQTSLLPAPERGSACKRLHLFLRWLVRSDDVDPGGWDDVGKERLTIPLDTHMFRLAQRLGLSGRCRPDGVTAAEVTAGFRQLRPDDPVRYDFALTRIAMSGTEIEDGFVARWRRSTLSP